MRVIDLITVASLHLRERGFDNTRLEVERMLGSVLGLSRLELYLAFERPLSDEDGGRFRAMYRRRLTHEPLQHILGISGFRDIEIRTDRRALIPRPETEVLVEEAVAFLRNRERPLVADLGTGSGVIALSVARELPGARVVAVDISDEALALAVENGRSIGVEDRISWVQGDMLAGLEGQGGFDAVLSNPPYVPGDDIDGLQPEVSGFEPRQALDGGPDGLRYLADIARGAHRHLKPGGLLLLECGDGQDGAVLDEIHSTERYTGCESLPDLTGRKRIIRAYMKQECHGTG